MKQLNEMLKAQFKGKYQDAFEEISEKDQKQINRVFRQFKSRVNPLKMLKGELPPASPRLTKEEKWEIMQNPKKSRELSVGEENSEVIE